MQTIPWYHSLEIMDGSLENMALGVSRTNFELATHAPMMVHIPRKTDDGITTEKLVEMVDLFPTIVEAAGFPPIPLCPEGKFHRHHLV